jgi:hypothetical protein
VFCLGEPLTFNCMTSNSHGRYRLVWLLDHVASFHIELLRANFNNRRRVPTQVDVLHVRQFDQNVGVAGVGELARAGQAPN